MTRDDRLRPPRFLRALLAMLLPLEERAALLAEMDDLYRHRARRDGPGRARFWYLRHAVLLPLHLGWDRVTGRVGRGRGDLGSVLGDLRVGLRVLRRRPAYALASVLTLGIGVGGVATVYNAANWVLLRPVPGVADTEDLVTVRLELSEYRSGSIAFPMSDPDLETLERRIPSLRELAGSREVDVHLSRGTTDATPRRVRGAVVTPDFFEVLRMTPARGRFFHPADGGAGTRSVVLGHGLWRGEFGGAADVTGRVIRVNGEPFTVVGVAPAGFRGPELPGATELWFPEGALPHLMPGTPAEALDDRGRTIWRGLVGRTTPGVDPARIRTEGAAAISSIREEFRRHSFAARFDVGAYPGLGLSPRLRGPVHRTLALLAGTAGLLLLLAMANVTNLALTHAAARTGTTAVHRALGAGRLRLARGVLAEHLLLGGGGAVVGGLVLLLGTTLFREASLSTLGASLSGIEVDGRVVAFTVAVSLLASLLSGVVPAVAAGSGDLMGWLKGGDRAGSRRARSARSGLVILQVALSVVLLVGGALLARSVVALRDVPVGFRVDEIFRFSVDPYVQGYDETEVTAFLGEVGRRLGADPGVVAAGFASPRPVNSSFLTFGLHRPGAGDEQDAVVVEQLRVTPGFLEAMGVELLAGRGLSEDDPDPWGESESHVMVVTRSLVRRALPDIRPERAVGRTLIQPWDELTVRIVGVVEDVRLTGLAEEAPPVAFRPWGQGDATGPVTGWVRARDPAAMAALGARVRSVVQDLDPELPVYETATVRSRFDELIVEHRIVARLAVALALVGLVLAAVGLQGLLGYMVTERRREIGVRAAFGASPGSLVGRLVRRGLTLTGVGLVAGAVGAAWATDLIESRLFGVGTLDPVSWGGGVTMLLAAALLATWVPAVRATRVSPAEVLDAE